jgi:hypothetical protein
MPMFIARIKLEVYIKSLFRYKYHETQLDFY